MILRINRASKRFFQRIGLYDADAFKFAVFLFIEVPRKLHRSHSEQYFIESLKGKCEVKAAS